MKTISHPKKFGRDLPVYDLPKPKSGNGGRGCVIYSLFIGDERKFVSDYHRYLINSAFWSAHAWRVNCDLIKKGYDIYFCVEKRLYRQRAIREQFEMANLTDSVILFDPLLSEATRRKVGLKLYAFLRPELNRYERVYLMDADMFLCRQENASLIDIDCIDNIGEDESLPNIFAAEPIDRFKLNRITCHSAHDKGVARLRNHLEGYLGASLTRGYRCWGGMYTCNPASLRRDFRDMVRQLTADVCYDEYQYAIYCLKIGRMNTPLGKLWRKNGLTLVGNFYKNFMKPDTPEHFFEHAIINPDEPEFEPQAWFEKWYSHIGIYRRQ